MNRKLTRDKVISVVNGKDLVGVYFVGKKNIVFETSPRKADKIIEIFNGIEPESDPMYMPFEITSICREDLKGVLDQDDKPLLTDKEILKISDSNMECLAGKIADGVMDDFWVVLRTMIEDRKKELLED